MGNRNFNTVREDFEKAYRAMSPEASLEYDGQNYVDKDTRIAHEAFKRAFKQFESQLRRQVEKHKKDVAGRIDIMSLIPRRTNCRAEFEKDHKKISPQANMERNAHGYVDPLVQACWKGYSDSFGAHNNNMHRLSSFIRHKATNMTAVEADTLPDCSKPFIIFRKSEDNGLFYGSSKPYLHNSYDKALTEARRLQDIGVSCRMGIFRLVTIIEKPEDQQGAGNEPVPETIADVPDGHNEGVPADSDHQSPGNGDAPGH